MTLTSETDVERSDPAGSAIGLTMVLAAAVLWGTGGVGASLVASHSALSWPAILAVRLLTAGAIMLAVTVLTGELGGLARSRPRGAARHLALASALMATTSVTYYWSIGLIGVATATVLTLGSAPLAVTVSTAVHGRSLPSRRVTLALAAAMAGLVLVTGVPGAGEHSAVQTIQGCGLSLVSGLTFAALTLVTSRSTVGITPGTLVALSFTLAGALCATAVCIARAGFPLATLDRTAWLGMACAAIFHGALGFFLFYAGLHRGVPATTAAIATLVEACAAALLAVAILHEHLSAATLAGIALVMVAVVLAERGRPRIDPVALIEPVVVEPTVEGKPGSDTPAR